MKDLRHIAVAAVLAFSMSGCATMDTSNATDWFDHWSKCALAGGVAGGAVGAVIDDGKSAVTGAVGGAVIGGVLCVMMDRKAMADYYSDGDADNDGVMDSRDRCPGTMQGTAVDNNGCKLAERITLDGVNFFHDSARLTESSRAILDSAVRILVRHPDLSIEVAGHTDSQGAQEYNLGLSQRRADAVRQYLVSHGASAARVSSMGYGESEPVADNGTKQGRAHNRRVELRQR